MHNYNHIIKTAKHKNTEAQRTCVLIDTYGDFLYSLNHKSIFNANYNTYVIMYKMKFRFYQKTGSEFWRFTIIASYLCTSDILYFSEGD